jgi:hypothetical protein
LERLYGTFKGGWEDMNHPLVERTERTGHPFEFKTPKIKRCSCGCGELVASAYAHTIFEDEYFVDNFHVIAHLKNEGMLREVG